MIGGGTELRMDNGAPSREGKGNSHDYWKILQQKEKHEKWISLRIPEIVQKLFTQP